MSEKTLKYFTIDSTTFEEISDISSGDLQYISTISYAHTFTNCEYPWHWHNSVQFFRIIEGEMDYVVPSGTYHFHQGDIGFINRNILHMLRCAPDKTCTFEEHILSSMFISGGLDTNIFKKYVSPISDFPDFDIYKMDNTHRHFGAINECLKNAHRLFNKQPEFFELYVRELLSRAWIYLFEMSKDERKHSTPKASTTRLRQMLSYIGEHFTENITVPMIAEAGMCSYRECNRVFQLQLRTTPLDYLTNLRLQYACERLVQSQDSITYIATSSGFNSSSYFTKTFKAAFNMTPKEYRKTHESYSV